VFRRQLPLLIVALGGIVMILEYFFRAHWLSVAREDFAKWARVGFTAAVYVGILNLAFVNLQRVLAMRRGWMYHAVLLVALVGTFLPGVVVGWDVGPTDWVFVNVYTPLTATMFGLLAFFIASAAYRAFRIRNVEAALLLVSAVVVMLGNVPLFRGEAATLFSRLQTFVMEGPMTGGQRAILMAAAIGAIFFAMKILTGVDRSYFGGGE
jgi:hypothetical protein